MNKACREGNVFIIGDFNMPGILWKSQNTSTYRENRFTQVIQYNYLKSTERGTHKIKIKSNPVLDLLITDREEFISDISNMDP